MKSVVLSKGQLSHGTVWNTAKQNRENHNHDEKIKITGAHLRFLTIAMRLNRISPEEYLAMRSSIAGDATPSHVSSLVPPLFAPSPWLVGGISPRTMGPDLRPSSSNTCPIKHSSLCSSNEYPYIHPAQIRSGCTKT